MSASDNKLDGTLPPTASVNPSLSELLPPLPVPKRSWASWLSGVISIILLIAIILQLRKFGFARALEILPTSPYFWTAFAAYYVVLPTSEWMIYRRLWRIPFDGFAALLRKLISNDLLLGYSGEAYFYIWARRRMNLVAAPFGAVKDVSILSALAGNLMTLIMLVIAYPLVGSLGNNFNVDPQDIIKSAGFIILLSMSFFIFRKRIFSLPRGDLNFVFAMHVVRLLAALALSATLWHTGMPGVPIVLLVMLATLQLLVTRLPFVTNKEIVFAALAGLIVADDARAVIGLIATAILATHLFVGMILVMAELLSVRRT
jgi:hypothetical protein